MWSSRKVEDAERLHLAERLLDGYTGRIFLDCITVADGETGKTFLIGEIDGKVLSFINLMPLTAATGFINPADNHIGSAGLNDIHPDIGIVWISSYANITPHLKSTSNHSFIQGVLTI